MRWIASMLAVVLLSALCLGAAWGEDLYVKSSKADVLANPQFGSAVVATLGKGDKVSVEQKTDKWIRINAGTNSGWVASLLLGAKPPLNKVSLIKESDEQLQNAARRRASEVVSAGAARGLAAEDRRRASQDAAADYGALERIEGFVVPEAEVDAFAEALRSR